MKTIFSIIILIICGYIANLVGVFVLNIAGIPGSLVAGRSDKNSSFRYGLGIFISMLGQAYVYLAYVAFIVNWTFLAVFIQKVSFIIWPVSFFAAFIPIFFMASIARKEGAEDGYTNAQITALRFNVFVAFIAFFIFIIFPNMMNMVYFWVPYINY